MKKIDKKLLIKEGNYYKQLVCFSIFFFVAVLMFSIEMIKAFGTEKIWLAIAVYGLIILIPFGYFLGLRKICGVVKDISRINSKRFRIVERVAIDKQIVNNSSTTNDTQIIFSKDDGVWVSRKKSKEIKIGDTCYVVYLDGDENPCAIYSKRKYILDDDLMTLVK